MLFAVCYMLESTFVLLKGIGESTERRIWDSGVPDWQSFLACGSLPGIAPARKRSYDAELVVALRRLQEGHARYFSRCLKARDRWRLFEAFRARAVYLDIETTGGPPAEGEITVVGLYAHGRMTSLVRGESLTEERLTFELSKYDLVLTFFGSVFDLPYLRAKFPRAVLDHPHIDLCFAARRLGLAGGLKRIETLLDIRRPSELQGLDGWEAVRLWQAWRRGESAALNLLLRYNEADARNLEPLAELLYRRLADRYGPTAQADAGPV